MNRSESSAQVVALTADHLARVVAVDAAVVGRRRPGFFEKRLQAALRDPKGFVYTGYVDADGLQGFLLARLLEGEFGSAAPVAVMDAVGVDPAHQSRGIGRALMMETQDILRHKAVTELQSQADWRNLRMLRFFAGMGFQLAARYVMERDVAHMDLPVVQPEEETWRSGETDTDYSMPAADDYAVLSRDQIGCRSLAAGDLAELVRIDSKLMGHDRDGYYRRKLDEVLNETGIRVSLVAEMSAVVVGFIMARIDFGEFGRPEPVAVLDTLSVNPDYQHHGIATALLSQLLANLTTLRVERIRTEAEADRHQLLAFLQHCGFEPSQQLAFRLPLT